LTSALDSGRPGRFGPIPSDLDHRGLDGRDQAFPTRRTISSPRRSVLAALAASSSVPVIATVSFAVHPPLVQATGLTGAALLLYLLISEGSRLLFPPRNLVPVI